MKTKIIIQFNGTEEQLQAGCIGNGYTGFVNNWVFQQSAETPQTVNEFLAIKLREISPAQFINTATHYWEKRLGIDNYNASEMQEAMLKALSINVITE